MTNLTNLVFPIAGSGSRFKSEGFATPKPLLDIYGSYFFEVAALALISQIENYTLSFIVLREHCVLFEIHKKIKKVFPHAMISIIDSPTDGAAETTYFGLTELGLENGTLVVADCDQWIKGKRLQAMFRGLEECAFDIAIPVFESKNPAFSYVECDTKGKIIKIKEKQGIHKYAVSGCYGFRSLGLFNELYLAQNDWGNEKYMSSIIAGAILSDYKIQSFELDIHVPFGTPSEYRDALLNPHLGGGLHD
jgi:dTDP-glucose pyrophosphorylase